MNKISPGMPDLLAGLVHATMKFLINGAPTGARAVRLVIRNSLLVFCSILAIIGIGMMLSAPAAIAQSKNAGEIRGTVTDSAGATVPRAQVVATETSTGLTVKGTTGDSGFYDLPYVEAGQYLVSFTKAGFKTYVASGVGIHIETITINAVLEVGAASSSITVVSAPDLLQTESTEISLILPSTEVTELPVVGRSMQTLIELLPGVSPGKGGSDTGNQGSSINGAQQYQSIWLLDGGTSTLPVSFNPDSLMPPLEAIAEVNMVTQGFGAESGNGLSSFNVITKSGTNKFHGSLWEFNQNDIYDASPKNWSSVPQAKPPVRWNLFGGTVGGPIDRNKLFFFFSYQKNKVASDSHGLYTFPTDDVRAGDFSNSLLAQIFDPATTTTVGGVTTRTTFDGNKIPAGRLDPVAVAIQKLLPEPNAINPSNPYFNNYYFSAPTKSDISWYNWKLDGDIFANHHLYTSGQLFKQATYYPSPDAPIDALNLDITEVSSQITDAWTLSSTRLNELRLSFAREALQFASATLGLNYPTKIGLPQLPGNVFPNISTSGSGPNISLSSGINSPLHEDNITIADTFTWILGKHTIKAGGEYDNWTDNGGWQSIQSGTFNFNGIGTRDPASSSSTGMGYADFMLGYAQSWSVNPAVVTGGRVHNEQFFVQDYYKMRPNLTLNAGARIINQNGWHEQHNRIALYSPTLINPATSTPGALGYAGDTIPSDVQASVLFLSPRVGFAWTPVHATSVRGGFGFYTVPWSATSYLLGSGTGWSPQGAEQSQDNLTEVFQLSSGPPPPIYPTSSSRTASLLNGQNVPYVPYNSPMTYVEQWQLSLERQFGNYLVAASYVANASKKLPFATDINQATDLETGTRPNLNYQQIDATRFIGSGNYNSMQLTGKRQMANGFSFLANYTWSKALDTGTGNGGNGTGLDNWQNAYSPAENYGAAGGDVRHLLNGSIIYQLPFGKGRNYLSNNVLLDALIGGWQGSSAYTYRSGLPFTPVMGTANLSFAQSGTWYPNRTGSGKVAHPSVNEWFDPNAFVAPAEHTFGNSKRDILYGPRYANVDFSMSKTFSMNAFDDPMSFQLKLDATDIFNHPNYGQPNANIGSGPQVGTISSSYTNRSMQVGGVFRF
jgi:Carboxypeptidase regulatory-like domain